MGGNKRYRLHRYTGDTVFTSGLLYFSSQFFLFFFFFFFELGPFPNTWGSRDYNVVTIVIKHNRLHRRGKGF